MSLEKLGQLAAIYLRDSIEEAIKKIENQMKLGSELIKADKIEEYTKEYFRSELPGFKKSIDDLKRFRAEAHKRAFDAYMEENPVTQKPQDE